MYEAIIAVGSTHRAFECAKTSLEYAPVTMIENEKVPSNRKLAKDCVENGIPFLRMDKRQTMEYLDSITDKTLVISIYNQYLFTKEIVDKPNLTIINLHSALLPRHPGRNTAAWGIFEGDTTAGVTWHYIDENTDAGYMIAQKEFNIDEEITAEKLFFKLNVIGIELFNEIIRDIFYGSAKKIKLNTNQNDVRFAKDVPNNGVFDLTWPFKKASAFLRALDYGRFPQFPPPKIMIDGECYSWENYVLLKEQCYKNELYCFDGENLILTMNGGSVILRKIKRNHTD